MVAPKDAFPAAALLWGLIMGVLLRRAAFFMDRIFFRQEALTTYETTSGFSVRDDGSVHCEHYWSLSRSTSRLGNELLCTGVGDFRRECPWKNGLTGNSTPSIFLAMTCLNQSARSSQSGSRQSGSSTTRNAQWRIYRVCQPSGRSGYRFTLERLA